MRDTPLIVIFPRLYRICRYKHTFIQDILDIWSNIKRTPTLLWTRQLRSQESIDASEIYNIIQAYNTTNLQDTLIWNPANNIYTTKNMYSLLSEGSHTNFRWSFIWTLKIPPKIKVFVWKICKGILPTKAFLQSRITNNNIITMCTTCNSGVKDIQHIFNTCPRARATWSFLDTWWKTIDIKLDSTDWLWKIFHATKTHNLCLSGILQFLRLYGHFGCVVTNAFSTINPLLTGNWNVYFVIDPLHGALVGDSFNKAAMICGTTTRQWPSELIEYSFSKDLNKTGTSLAL